MTKEKEKRILSPEREPRWVPDTYGDGYCTAVKEQNKHPHKETMALILIRDSGLFQTIPELEVDG